MRSSTVGAATTSFRGARPSRIRAPKNKLLACRSWFRIKPVRFLLSSLRCRIGRTSWSSRGTSPCPASTTARPPCSPSTTPCSRPAHKNGWRLLSTHHPQITSLPSSRLLHRIPRVQVMRKAEPVRQSASASSHDNPAGQEPHKKWALFFSTFGCASRGFAPLHQGLPTAPYESLCHCPPGRIPGARDRGPAGMPHKMCYVFFLFSRLTEWKSLLASC